MLISSLRGNTLAIVGVFSQHRERIRSELGGSRRVRGSAREQLPRARAERRRSLAQSEPSFCQGAAHGPGSGAGGRGGRGGGGGLGLGLGNSAALAAD